MYQAAKHKSPRRKNKIGSIKFRIEKIKSALYKHAQNAGLQSQFAKQSYALLQTDKRMLAAFSQALLVLETVPTVQSLALS